MDAICLVCESAYEVEGELDLLVQIECPKCHRGVLMLDAENESDITHYDVADSGIFDSSPPEPLDVAASVLLGGSQEKTPSAEDRWIAQAEDISLARDTTSMTTIQTDAVPLDSRLHDNNQTVDSAPLDAAAMSLYNSEPEDLSRTLPEIPNPYAEPLTRPTPVPLHEMLDDHDAPASEDSRKAPDTEVEMMPYGTGTAVDLPPIAMPSRPELSVSPTSPLTDLEGMLDSAITSLPTSDAAKESSRDSAFAIDDESPQKPVTTQEHASFDQAFAPPGASTIVDETPGAKETSEDSLIPDDTIEDASIEDASIEDASAKADGAPEAKGTLDSSFFHDEAALPEDTPNENPAGEETDAEVSVTTNDLDEDNTLSTLNNLNNLDEPSSATSTSVDLPALEDAGEPEEDEPEPPPAEEDLPEVAINPQILDDEPLGGSLSLVDDDEPLLPPAPNVSYDPSEPHELEPLNPEASSTIDANAFSFDTTSDENDTRRTRPLRTVQSIAAGDLPDTGFVPEEDESDEAPLLLTVPSGANKDADAEAVVEVNVSTETTDTSEEELADADAKAEEEAKAEEAKAEEAKVESVAAEEAESPVVEAPAKAEAAMTPLAMAPVKEPPSSPSGEMMAPRTLTPAPESKPARARSFSLAPPVDADTASPPKELNRTLAFGFKLPDDVEQEAKAVATAQAEDSDEELVVEQPEMATPSAIAAASGSFDTPTPPKEASPVRSSEALPMAGFGKVQEEPDTPKAPDAPKEPAQSDPALAETQEAPGEKGGMIDFDNLSADFFSSPAKEKDRSIEQLSDLDDLIQRQQQDNKKIMIRVAIALPLLIAFVVLMFWGINKMGKGKGKAGVTKRRQPPRKAPTRVAVRTKVPKKVGMAPLLLDAGTAPDTGATPDAGGIDAGTAPDAAGLTPDIAAPRVAPRRIIPPRRRIERRPPPRRRIRRRPPPRRRIRRRPPPRRRIRRRPPPRRRYNRAAAKRSYARGQKQLFANNINGAIRQYKRAINADSRYAPAYRALGAAYMRKGNKPAAKRAWRTFLRLKPKDPMAKFIRKMIK